MKVALITDTHFNFKKGNKNFHDYFEKFYNNVFFPTLEKRGIDTIIHMGDIFDNRKGTDYWSIDWTKRVILDKFKKYKVYLSVGNHDIFYKNTTELSSPILLMNDYKNIKIMTSPETVNVGDTDILFIPWITPEGEQDTLNHIKETPAKIVMGHLELNDFYPQRGHAQTQGRDTSIFKKFDRVFTGHYHTRSDDGKIFYIGNPYQLYWSDYNDKRGFAIFDTITYELEYINNPYEMFKIIHYRDDAVYDLQEYDSCIVKLIIKEKKDKIKYEKFLDFLLEQNILDLKIIEDFVIKEDIDVDEEVKNEDTLSLLKKYIDESEIELNKNRLKELLSEIYKESFQMI
jgi:DNA repair exonuclease SbcCD nuclease subunit